MKKILALILVVACLFSVVACNRKNKNADLVKFEEYFASSIPTKSETTIRNTYSGNTFEGKITLTTGTIDGKTASKLESQVASLRALEDLNLNPFKTPSESLVYVEGMGTTENGGRKWNAEGTNFAPAEGSIVLNLDADNFENVAYDEATDTITLTVPGENAKTVLENYIDEDQDFDYDTVITITAAGGRIASIRIEYTVDSQIIGDIGSEVELDEIKVVIRTNYSYDIQDITIK